MGHQLYQCTECNKVSTYGTRDIQQEVLLMGVYLTEYKN